MDGPFATLLGLNHRRKAEACATFATHTKQMARQARRYREAGRAWANSPNQSLGLEEELLDAPVEKFADVKLVFGGAGDFVNPAKLL